MPTTPLSASPLLSRICSCVSCSFAAPSTYPTSRHQPAFLASPFDAFVFFPFLGAAAATSGTVRTPRDPHPRERRGRALPGARLAGVCRPEDGAAVRAGGFDTAVGERDRRRYDFLPPSFKEGNQRQSTDDTALYWRWFLCVFRGTIFVLRSPRPVLELVPRAPSLEIAPLGLFTFHDGITPRLSRFPRGPESLRFMPHSSTR